MGNQGTVISGTPIAAQHKQTCIETPLPTFWYKSCASQEINIEAVLTTAKSNGDHAFPLSFGQHFKCYFRSCCTVPIAAKRAATCVREALTLSCSYGAIWQLECLRRRSKEDAGAQRCGSERIQQGI